MPLKGRSPGHDARPHPILRPKHLSCALQWDDHRYTIHPIGSLKFGFCSATRRHQNREHHQSHRLAHHQTPPILRPHQDARSGTKAGPSCNHPRDARPLRCIYVAHHLSFIKRASSSWLPRYHENPASDQVRRRVCSRSSHVRNMTSRPWPREPARPTTPLQNPFPDNITQGPNFCVSSLPTYSRHFHHQQLRRDSYRRFTTQSPFAQSQAGNDR